MTKSTSYISKGQRPNVSKKTRNLGKAERRANRPVEDVLKRLATREEIINKPRGQKQKELQERYIQQDVIEVQAFKLFSHYKDVGFTWAAAVQSAKTNYSERVHDKWGPRLKALRDSEKDK